MKNTLTIGLITLGSLFVKAQSTPPNESCGKVLNLNGVWDHIVMNPVADSIVSLDDNDRFTVEFWLKTTTSSGNIFSLYTNTEFVSVDLYVKMHGGKVGTSETFTSLFTESTSPVNDNTWHHVAMSFDGDLARLYVDGVYMGAEDYNFFFQNNTRVSVGMSDLPGTGKQEFFDGQIDELKIWSSVRTEEEINSGMGTKLVGNESNLLAYFDFDEGNNSEQVLNNSPYDFNFNITSENLKDTRQNPDGSAPTKIDDVIITNPSCFEREDGAIEVEVLTEATSVNYSFSIEPGFTDVNTSTGLGHGTYQAIIRDSEGCYDSIKVDLDHGEEYEITIEDLDYELFIEISPRPSSFNSHWIDCESGETVAVRTKTFFTPGYDSYYKMAYVLNETCKYESECIPWGAAKLNEVDLSNQFEVYPNPTNGVLNVNFDESLKGGTILIYNLTGTTVKTMTLSEDSNAAINLNAYENGVYFVEVNKNEFSGVYKVVKK